MAPGNWCSVQQAFALISSFIPQWRWIRNLGSRLIPVTFSKRVPQLNYIYQNKLGVFLHADHNDDDNCNGTRISYFFKQQKWRFRNNPKDIKKRGERGSALWKSSDEILWDMGGGRVTVCVKRSAVKRVTCFYSNRKSLGMHVYTWIWKERKMKENEQRMYCVLNNKCALCFWNTEDVQVPSSVQMQYHVLYSSWHSHSAHVWRP